MRDEQIAMQLKKGDTQALCLLIDRYGDHVANILSSFLGAGLTAQDLEEIASDVFFTLWQQRNNLQPDKSLKAYITAIAKNTGRKRLRKMKTVEPLPEGLDIPSSELSAAERMEQSEKQQHLLRVLETLKTPDREIFYRYYYLEQTTGEIAKLMGMNRSTVMSRLARGRSALKMKMEDMQHED